MEKVRGRVVIAHLFRVQCGMSMICSFCCQRQQVGLEEVVVNRAKRRRSAGFTWIHDYAPAIRGLVLASPAFKVKLYVPLARPALALWHRLVVCFLLIPM
ncbi:hypothetical protein ACNKHW_11115 [Shigella flexneri]